MAAHSAGAACWLLLDLHGSRPHHLGAAMALHGSHGGGLKPVVPGPSTAWRRMWDWSLEASPGGSVLLLPEMAEPHPIVCMQVVPNARTATSR